MRAITSHLKPWTRDLSVFPSLAWWIEITTSSPSCVYYFGPFQDFKEASQACPGYIEDLVNEGAEKIHIYIMRCCPVELTRYDETD